MEEESKVIYHETNEGRDTKQGIAGFEGNNALLFLIAMGLSLLFFRQSMDNWGFSGPLAAAFASVPMILTSAYVFGLKQGKPKSYDVELAEWLIVRGSGKPYFSPNRVQPIALPWVNVHKKPGGKWREES